MRQGCQNYIRPFTNRRSPAKGIGGEAVAWVVHYKSGRVGCMLVEGNAEEIKNLHDDVASNQLRATLQPLYAALPAPQAPAPSWLDDQDFYEFCQQYRHDPIGDAKPFEALKDYIRSMLSAPKVDV